MIEWWCLDNLGSTCFEVHDFALMAVGGLDSLAELVGLVADLHQLILPLVDGADGLTEWFCTELGESVKC